MKLTTIKFFFFRFSHSFSRSPSISDELEYICIDEWIMARVHWHFETFHLIISVGFHSQIWANRVSIQKYLYVCIKCRLCVLLEIGIELYVFRREYISYIYIFDETRHANRWTNIGEKVKTKNLMPSKFIYKRGLS